MQRDGLNVLLCGLLVQALGFLKLLLIARLFGVGVELDGYYLALAIPAVVQGFVGGAVQTGFLPVYVELRSIGQQSAATALFAAVFYRLLLVLILACIVLSVNSEILILWLAPYSSAEVQISAQESLRILSIAVLANGLVDYMSMLLNAHKRFVVAALGPSVSAIVSTAVLFIWPEWGLNSLVFGLLLGMLAQLAITLIACTASQIPLGLGSFHWAHPEMGRVISLIVPILLGVALSNVNTIVLQFFAATTGDGGVSTLGYANRLHSVFVQVVIMGVSSVLLANFSEHVALHHDDRLKESLRDTFRISLLGTMIMLIGVTGLGSEVTRILLMRGEFDEADANNVAQIWMMLTCGLLPIAWGIFVSKYFQSRGKPWVLTGFAILSLSANIALACILVPIWGLVGLAAASGGSYLAGTIGLHWSMERDLGYPMLKAEGPFAAKLLVLGIFGMILLLLTHELLIDLAAYFRIALMITMVSVLVAILVWQSRALELLRRHQPSYKY